MRTHECEAPMRDAVGTPLSLAAEFGWAADHAPPVVRLSGESLQPVGVSEDAPGSESNMLRRGRFVWRASVNRIEAWTQSSNWPAAPGSESNMSCAASIRSKDSHHSVVHKHLPFGLGATLNRRGLRNGHPSCRKIYGPNRPKPDHRRGSCGEEIEACVTASNVR